LAFRQSLDFKLPPTPYRHMYTHETLLPISQTSKGITFKNPAALYLGACSAVFSCSSCGHCGRLLTLVECDSVGASIAQW
jgi:hypothetical protein